MHLFLLVRVGDSLMCVHGVEPINHVGHLAFGIHNPLDPLDSI